MKAKELRVKGAAELPEELLKLRREQFNLRMAQASGQAAKPDQAGKVRRNNEDHFMAARFDRTMRTLATNLPEGEVPRQYAETVDALLVADGVGGAAAGEVASRTAVHAIVDLVLETPDWIMRLMAYFGGPVRQIINDIGNEKVFDGRKGEALMGHPYIPTRQTLSDTAESVIKYDLHFEMPKSS